MIPDWLLPTFLLFPAMLWMFFGVGVPWALALLPRSDWRRPIMVAALSVALGPALTTTAMFLLGTFGHWSLAGVLSTMALIAAVGLVLALRPRSEPPSKQTADVPLSWIDLALILAILIAVLLRIWNTAYWPYDNYDEFWVYGYNAKIFVMQRAIPAGIGYYPQLLPLSLTYGQLAWGSLSEHAARTVVPYFELGSILMTYVAGARLISRRTGLIAAAVWTLYAHHAGWAQYADLEVPVTFYTIGAAAFFMLAWNGPHRRYALIGGLLAGAALWTKPTAGALVESVALIGGVLAIRMFRQHRPPKPVASIWKTLKTTPIPLYTLALLPMGGMWYVRNILFGHDPIVLPASYWQEAAQRSGQELGWPFLVAACLSLYLVIHVRRPVLPLLVGLGLLLVGILPSAFAQPDPRRLNILEYLILLAGSLVILREAWAWWRARPTGERAVGWLIFAFIAPYFVTWFWSYSYHYRLSFTMVPLFALLVAILLDRTLSRAVDATRIRIALSAMIILVAAIPGQVAGLSALPTALNGSLPDDHAKHAVANPALLALVDFLQARRNELNRPLRVAAPAELRLSFFFPEDDLRLTDLPTRLDRIADVDYFVDSSVGQRLYLINGKYSYNQILDSLTRLPVMRRVMTTDDGNFRFSVYTIDNAARFAPPKPEHLTDARFGSFARLAGWELSASAATPGSQVLLTLDWQALATTNTDYSVFVHLWDEKAQKLRGVWGAEPVSGAVSVWDGVPGTHFNIAYHTRLWQPGEFIQDEWMLNIAPDTPPGDYQLRVGLFDPMKGPRLPVTLDGQSMGDGLELMTFSVVPD